MEIDNLEDEPWKDSGETFTGKGPDGEDTIFVLQRRGSQTRLRPKGKAAGKGAYKGAGGHGGGSPGAPSGSPGGKGSKWVKGGCARCGRGTHWAKECRANKEFISHLRNPTLKPTAQCDIPCETKLLFSTAARTRIHIAFSSV